MWVLSRYADIIGRIVELANLLLGSRQSDGRAAGSCRRHPWNDRPAAARPTARPHSTCIPPGAISKALGEPVRALVAEQIEELKGKQQLDFAGDFTANVTAKILFRILGLPPGDDRKVRDQGRADGAVGSRHHVRKGAGAHRGLSTGCRGYAAEVIAERRRGPERPDLTVLPLSEINGERLAGREVLLTTTTLIMAGIESLGGFTVMLGLNLAEFPGPARTGRRSRSSSRMPLRNRCD